MRNADFSAGAAMLAAILFADVPPLVAAEARPFVPPEIGKSFSEGMAYQQLREQLLAAGWLPLRDPECWTNIGGEAAVCNRLPEVESCSVDGRCIMRFAHEQGRAKIRVGTDGPYEDAGVAGKRSAMKVKHWEFSALDGEAAASAACPQHGFDAFLRSFSANADILHAFTAPLVKVAEMQSTDNGDFARSVYMEAEDFHGFNLQYRGNAFHFVDAEGKADPAPLKVVISKAGQSDWTVRYNYGMSEGNAYRFEDRGGCWYLVEDLQAPSP